MSLEIEIQHRQGAFALDVSFRSEGRLTALFGRSGAGKTSVVNIIGGLVRPQHGRVVVEGRTLVDTERGVFLPKHRRRVGYVFQEGRLFPHLSVRQNLLYGRWFTPKPERYASFGQVVEMLGIGALLDRPPALLSGGEKQRVAIGRALLASPRLLLMDEPLAALDEERKTEILPYVERLRDETRIPIVYVSHALGEVARLATTLVVLADGRVAASGPVAEVMGRIDLFPRAEAGAVLEAAVKDHDDRFQLTRLRVAAGILTVPRIELAPGTLLRVRIRARDVMLATQPPDHLSALNVLPATVVEIAAGDGPTADIRLDCAGEDLLARLTRRSIETLGLAPGRPVHAVIKSVAFDRHTIGAALRGPNGADADLQDG
ncbi:molybdate transport system ATP-binding protein [Inquilinus ginsengisoli]|uniref:Molybdate transport system ATP-binding protein n=1 Tax=Inquilinus ginsengisoli TaxID=363840 RepID=A0ABU1JNW6_9PROT|nr:molybdenum ABC transporter ATP-binding protein [Inquilinus ginsengisoli]MDR6289234.1 molybdate transport system ATP-binding protein [Inquilinus ginsengisoli]